MRIIKEDVTMTKMVKELKRDMLDKVAGGAYNIDETIPGVQEFIQECLRQRQIGLSEGSKITNQLTQDMLYSKFIKLGLEPILHWWGFEDIMEKYYFAGEYYERP